MKEFDSNQRYCFSVVTEIVICRKKCSVRMNISVGDGFSLEGEQFQFYGDIYSPANLQRLEEQVKDLVVPKRFKDVAMPKQISQGLEE